MALITKWTSAKTVLAHSLLAFKPEETVATSTYMEWIFEALSFCRSAVRFEDKMDVLQFNNYRAALPCDVEYVIAVVRNDVSLVETQEIGFVYYKEKEDNHTLLNKNMNNYALTKDYIFLSVPKGEIYLYYKGIYLGEDGFPEVPDLPNFYEGCKFYILYQLSLANLYRNKISVNESLALRKVAMGEFDKCIAKMSFPSVDKYRAIMNRWHRSKTYYLEAESLYASSDSMELTRSRGFTV